MAQPASIAEYTDCISAVGLHSPNVCPGYDTKLFDDEASECGECEIPLYCRRSDVHSSLE